MRFQSSYVSVLRGSDKCLQKAALLARTDGCAPPIGDMLTGTGDKLASVCLLQLQDVRDLAMGVIERFTQNICGALSGREFFKEHKHREPQRFTALRSYAGIRADVRWFGKPSPDVGFAA